MPKNMNKDGDKVVDTKKDGVRSPSTSVANSRVRNLSHLKRSPTGTKSPTSLSPRVGQKNGHEQDTSVQNNTNFTTEQLNPQTLHQQSNDLLSIGSWSQPPEKDEREINSLFLYGNFMDPCPRHSSMVEATWTPRQQLPPYERWVAEDICDGAVVTLSVEDGDSWTECTCMSPLVI